MRYEPKNIPLMVQYVSDWERQGHIVSVGRKVIASTMLGWQRGGLRGLRLLDFGCGTGHFVQKLVDEGAEAVGLDLVREYFPMPEGWGRGRLVQGDVQHLPFAENTFDAVFALDVLEHCGDFEGGVREIHRVLKPGGQIVSTLPAMNVLYSQLDELQGHERRFYRREVRIVLEHNGFAVDRNTYLYSYLLPAAVYRKWLYQLFPIPASQSELDLYRSFVPPRREVSAALWWLLHKELAWLRRHDLPFGTTLLTIGTKTSQKN